MSEGTWLATGGRDFEGRLHLGAFALGYGASGMTVLACEIPRLLQEELQAMLFTCVGVPTYRSRRGADRARPPRGRRRG